MKWRVLITCPHLQSTIDHYRGFFSEHSIQLELPQVIQQLTESELLDIIDRYDGVIAGDDEFTAKVMQRAKRLRVIAKWGIGVDGIDLDAAERLGIRVSNTPGAFADEVADVVVGYIVLLARQLHRLDESVRSGKWAQIRGVSLRGKTLGVIGTGSIGRAVVRRAVVMGMSVIGHDVVPPPATFVRGTGLRPAKLEELLQASDFISLNCNLTSSNRHMLGRQEFSLMKAGVCIINTARGPLIDERALVEALEEGKVAGAALDVFEREPLPPDSRLRRFDNCIFGTHNSSNTYEAVMRVNELAIRNLLSGLEGAPS